MFLEHCQLLESLIDYFIAIHEEEERDDQENRTWYWANDFDEEYPMTYRPDNDSTVSNPLLRNLDFDSSFTVPLTNDQQISLTRYFRAYRPHRQL